MGSLKGTAGGLHRVSDPCATDADRIEAARLIADKLAVWLAWNHMDWAHYADSVGGVVSVVTPQEVVAGVLVRRV